MSIRANALRWMADGEERTTHEVQRRWPEYDNQAVSSELCRLVREGLMTKRKAPSPEYKRGGHRFCNFYRIVHQEKACE